MTRFASPWPAPRWIAHRGAGKLAPENTLAAFRHGSSLGQRAFECDVKLSADGVAFLLHDDTLDRTSNGSGPAGALPWQALSQLDAGSWQADARWAGEPPPTLQAIARYVLAQGAWLNLEIKPCPGTAGLTGQAVAAQAARLWAGASRPPLLSSFEVDALAAAQAEAPKLPRALLLDTLWDGWQVAADALGCCAVVTHHRLMDAALCAALHAAGRAAMVYTVNDAAEAERLLACGVDHLITDAVDRFKPSA